MRIARAGDLAGNGSGAVAILATSPAEMAFSADCVTWQTVSMPGSSAASPQGVATFRSGFVAVGDMDATRRSPVAWRSTDGRHWTLAVTEAHAGDGLYSAHAGEGGLVGESTTAEVPGRTSFWTSADGRSWKVSAADPLGVFQDGEGAGSANGSFSGDGTRLLGYGSRAFGQPTEYWTSPDGTHWARLALTGDTGPSLAGQTDAFLLRDGVLFSGYGAAWFGAAVR
jgi:hypothetical protein